MCYGEICLSPTCYSMCVINGLPFKRIGVASGADTKQAWS